MPSQKPNIVQNLRAKHEPHQKLVGRVLGLENRVSKLEGGGTKALPPASDTKALPPASDTKKISADSFKKGTAFDPGYAARVQGKDATGEYLSPEERKARFKKTKITGADIKRTGAIGSAERTVKTDTTGASALAIRKPQVSGDVAKAEDVTPQDQAQPTESLIGPLKTIDNSVNSIVETLKQSNKADTKAKSDARKTAEKDRRKKAEGKLESITGPLGKAAQKILAPVQNIWGKILKFLGTVLFGNVAVKLWKWFSDPKNGEKVTSIFRFIGDWWPLLVSTMLSFAPLLFGPAGFIIGVVALLAWGMPKIIDAIEWVKNLFGGGVQKELDGINKESDKQSADLTKNIESDLEKDTQQILKNNDAPDTKIDDKQQPDQLKEVDQKKDEAPPALNQFAEGGEVPGKGNKDTVPAMLTPGEFVMSKGAVQQYGANTLAGMNAAAGGTNRPTVGRYEGGGMVFNREYHAGGPRIYYKGGGKVEGLPAGLGGGGGGLNALTEQAKVKTWGSAIGDFFSGNDGRSRIRGIDRQDVGEHIRVDRNRSGWEDHSINMGPQKPIALINPPVKVTTKIAYDNQMQQQQQANAAEPPRQDLPEFNPSSMRSMAKIKTLGIVV